MTNSNVKFNVKQTPTGRKREAADCGETDADNLPQFSKKDMPQWIYGMGYTELSRDIVDFQKKLKEAIDKKFLEK